MQPPSSLAEYYARRAGVYERIYGKPERQEELTLLKRLVAAEFAGENVLELACGTGYWTEVVAQTARAVTALDINEEVLEIARQKPGCIDRVVFGTADNYQLPAFSESFSAGLAAFWWSHVPKSKLGEFLERFHQSLQPGAKVMFLDNVYAEGSSTPISRTDEEGNTFQTRHLDDGTSHEVLKNFPVPHELEHAVGKLGTEVRVQWWKYYWVLTYKTASIVRSGL